MTEEGWKQVPGYTYYDVSTHGRVRSWSNCHGGRREEPRILRPALSSTGYLTVSLCKNGRAKTFKVHTLVLTVFVDPRSPGLECCHADGSRTNNHLSNLRWDTRSANMRDAIKHGSWVPNVLRGEASGMAKLTEEQVVEIRRAYAGGGVSYRELGEQQNVGLATISDVVRRKTWAHVSAPEGE